MAFKNINISELSFNPFTKIGKEWALITGGDRENYNTMFRGDSLVCSGTRTFSPAT